MLVLMAEPVLSPRQVAEILRCNYETVLRHIHAGLLDGVKRGNRYYILESAVDRFLASDDADADVA